MRVPLVDLKAQYLSLGREIDEAIARVHDAGNYVMGSQVVLFEDEWAAYCGASYCVAVSSGTDALYLALRALEANHVIMPDFTFGGAVDAWHRLGEDGTILTLVDVDEDGVLDPAKISEALEPQRITIDRLDRFSVIMPVHLYGYPAELPAGLGDSLVLEDAAQAHGQTLRGNVAAFSFYPTKNLGAMGQAGAVVTDDEDVYQLLKSLRSHGEGEKRFHYSHISGNYRMDELQAAVLRVKLPHLAGWNRRRREISIAYRALLEDVPGISFQRDHESHTYHIFAIRCEKRDELATFLEKRGIQTSVRYPVPIHRQLKTASQEFWDTQWSGDFPMAEMWARETLSLPVYPEMTDDHVEYVAEGVAAWAKVVPA